MKTPWIEVKEHQDEEDQAGPGFSEYIWQARFACRVGIRPHEEWAKLKWGFNAQALFDEALERQKLFLESQYVSRDFTGTEHPAHRTLAFRYIHRPGESLGLAVLGKIQARTNDEAIENATALCRELKSTFPYDYILTPACSQEEFHQLAGEDILDNSEALSHLAQIRRLEIPTLPDRRLPCLQGLWQSNGRAHEQIWRSLAASPYPLLMNISLRSTILYPKELERLSNTASEVAGAERNFPNTETFQILKRWNELYLERRLAPWQKFFYVQIHLAATCRMDENLFRAVGTSLTLKSAQYPSLGYQVVIPEPDRQPAWRCKIKNLDMTFSINQLPITRLAELADLEEVFAAIRLPYMPPDDGFPVMKFAVDQKP